MNIVDIFPYFNEKELLELRINLLQDHVDKFIICDANRTHSGKPKEFTLKTTLNELNLLSEKIKIIEVDLSIYDNDNSPLGNWKRERFQRNAAQHFINTDDVCIVSDCDEIINPNFIKYYVKSALSALDYILRIPMINLCGKANLQVLDENYNSRQSSAAYICLHNHIKQYSLSEMREIYTLTSYNQKNIWLTDNNKIENAGWHFSWMGDAERMINKYQSFMHCDDYIVNSIYTYSNQSIEDFMNSYIPTDNAVDPLGRTDHILKEYDIKLLPDKLFQLPNVMNLLLPKYVNFEENWFNYSDLYLKMIDRFPSGSKFVEIGCWKGQSAYFMCNNIIKSKKEIEFFCIDTWQGSEEHIKNYDLTNLYETFLNNMKLVESYYFPLKLDSISASKRFKDNSLDFVFIDAAHDYDSVKADILAWLPKVKKNGILAGHDYYPNSLDYCGVYVAVNEIFDKNSIEQLGDCFIIDLNKINETTSQQNTTTLLSILEKNPLLSTDKNTVCFKKYPDKWMYYNYFHSYVENFYEKEFSKYQNKPIDFCEIGIDTGASFFIWNEYFHKDSNILGIDIQTDRINCKYDEHNFNNVSYIIKNAYDSKLVNILTDFDIIIDDGPHTLESQISCINLYFPKLKKDGVLIIEDVASLDYIDELTATVPEKYRQNIRVINLIDIDNRFDSILFVINK